MSGLAVLASGTGTILEAIIAARLPVGLVVADRPCRALDIAVAAGIPSVLYDRRDFGYHPARPWDRSGFSAGLADLLEKRHTQLVAMAGFMTILTPVLFDTFPGRVLNTHPSLLPEFKGGQAVRDALAAGATRTGCTVHIATAQLDAGPILAQASIDILPGDTKDALQERIKVVERQLYPRVIREQLAAVATH